MVIKRWSKLALLFFATSFMLNYSNVALASTRLDIVISEIAWAGSADSASDEWIELYNNTSTPVDLSGWTIEDDNGAQNYELNGIINAHSYFLIEGREIATSIQADQVKALSLSNAGDSLTLRDIVGNEIDSVNSSSSAWPAGNNTTHATMERINNTAEGDNNQNWRTSTINTVATASTSSAIIGTPKTAGTMQETPQTVMALLLTPDKSTVHQGEEFALIASVNNATNISNWGIDLLYDPNTLEYVSSVEGNFLSDSATVATSFQGGLENNMAGRIVLAGARTTKPLVGKSGNGELFTVTFRAKSNITPGNTIISTANNSFFSTPNARVSFSPWPQAEVSLSRNDITISPITNLLISPGSERYSLTLTWTPSTTANSVYEVYRKNTAQNFQLLGTTTNTSFTDSDLVSNGGNIIPHSSFTYRVIAIQNGQASDGVDGIGIETRGIKGDNNRSDRVDGEDLENIARLWTTDSAEQNFNSLVDTSLNGSIDGSDLIDLAVSWAKTYS